MINPLVTVGVTCYNSEKYIRSCLESVLNQTYFNIELIIVDDCSTDGTINIVNDLVPHAHLMIHENNSGSEMWGRCDVIEKASGAYLMHLDADDFLQPDFIEKHLKELIKYPDLDWIAANVNVIDSENKLISRWDYKDFPTTAIEGLYRGYQTASVPVPLKGLFKVSFLQQNRLSWYTLAKF